MPTWVDALPLVVAGLSAHFGSAPAVGASLAPFQAILYALLNRSLADGRCRAILGCLDEAGLSSPETLAGADLIEIGDAIRAGRLSVSAQTIAPLKHFAQWLVDRHGGDMEQALDDARLPASIRGELASIRGLGPGGADAILLFGLGRPAYPIDRATYRVLARHGWIDPVEGYEEIQEIVVDGAVRQAERRNLDAVSLLQNLAHGMEQVGSRYCRAAAPRCDGCPLESLLPEGGPREPDA